MRAVGWAALALAALGTSPALAFNCAKASTAVEKEICGNGAALGANDRMEKAYFALRETLGAAGRKTLLDGQKAWLGWRDQSCGPVADCLIEQGNARAEELEKTPPGMAPFRFFQKGVANGYEVGISGYRFVEPAGKAEKAYNAWVDAQIAETPHGQPPDPTEGEHAAYSHELSFDLRRLSGRVISAAAYSYAYSGGAHPNGWSTAINLDRTSGAALNSKAVFGAANLRKLADDCARQIVEWHSDQYGDLSQEEALRQLEGSFPGVVADHVGDMARWHFADEGGVIRFDSYAIAPYAAGPSECTFSYEQLRGLAGDPGLFSGGE